MQPSSLILLAIVVVWAAYLVPHWVRRRDELSQSRAGDRFSGGLRVLKRRERSGRPGRSGDPLLTSPRVIVDTDGELLYIPADRLLSERLTGSSMSLPQSAQPGETLTGAPVETGVPVEVPDVEVGEPAAPVEAVEATTNDEREDAGHQQVPTGEKVFDRTADDAPRVDVAPLAQPVAQEAAAEPVAEEPVTEEPVTEEAVEAPTAADEAFAELQAGLLAGFGLTAPTSTPVNEIPAAAPVPSPAATKAPSIPPAPDARESFQDLVARPGQRPTPEPTKPEQRTQPTQSPKAAQPERAPAPEAEPEDEPATEYTTTQADLEAARLSARFAAQRRARSMAVLLLTTIVTWVFLAAGPVPIFIPLAATLLLAAHGVASRTAAVRSRETLTMLGAHLYAAEMAREHAERRRQAARIRARVEAEAAAAVPVPERMTRRAAAVSADTWDPIPVPPPTYQLKPAVHRPQPPVEQPQKPQAPAASERNRPQRHDQPVTRGSMPRRAADIERLLELDQEVDRPRAVNE